MSRWTESKLYPNASCCQTPKFRSENEMGGPYQLGVLPQPHQQGRKVANPLLFALSHKSRAPAYVSRLTKQRSSVKFAAPEIDTTLVALESSSRCSITPRQVTEGSCVFQYFLLQALCSTIFRAGAGKLHIVLLYKANMQQHNDKNDKEPSFTALSTQTLVASVGVMPPNQQSTRLAILYPAPLGCLFNANFLKPPAATEINRRQTGY
jgi:hypothetical protein